LKEFGSTLYDKSHLDVSEGTLPLGMTSPWNSKLDLSSLHRMRKCYAWLLLFVTTTQWVGGHLCFEVSYLMAEERAMTRPEQAISDEIFNEMGIEANVNILPKGQRHQWGLDYGNYFAFEKTDSAGNSVAFTIDYGSRSVTWEQVADQVPVKQQGDADSMALAKFLFGLFFFEPPSHLYAQKKRQIAPNFSLCNIHGRLNTQPTSPPPDLYC
jgi:hypothetical protein